MHTVIITDPYTTSLFAKYRYLFAPFFNERGGSVCYCRWHKGQSNIDRAVPELYKAIKGHPEWRAIILVRSLQEDLYDPNNPFDFKCNHAFKTATGAAGSDEGKLVIRVNPAPLVQLTHMLAGFPSLGVKGYETGYVYCDEKTGMYKECMYKSKPILQSDIDKYTDDICKKYEENCKKKEKTVSQNDIEKLKNNYREKFEEKHIKIFGSNIKLKMVEVPYSPEEKKEHEKLSKTYAFNENRPSEVLLLSIREQYTPDDHKETIETVRRTWQFHYEEESSSFWKVYPSSCRFLCYDLINPEHTLYDRELWRFFLLTLSLAINQIPSQALQAYHLYKANLHINKEELERVFYSRIENLMSFREIIQERMSRVSELTQSKKKELVPAQYIQVDFEQIEESDVKAKSGKLGLATDCPVSESQLWHEHIKGTRHTIENILFAPQEIVAEKAFETRRKIDSFSGVEQVLDRFQVDRIRRRIDGLESQIINTELYGMLDADEYKAEVAEAGDAVRKYIKLRFTKRVLLLISLGSLLAYLFGFIPYLINSARLGGPVFGAAFGLAVISLALLAGGALLTLRFLRYQLIKKIQSYNRDVSNIFERMKSSAKVFSDYFSNICTYMYARSLLSGVILKKDNDNSAVKIQKAHLAYLENEIEWDKTICSLYGKPLDVTSWNGSFTNINEELLDELPAKCQFYELSPFKEKNTMKLTTSPTQRAKNILTNNNTVWEQHDTGITLDAPYSFITGINLAREEIYDHKEEA